MLYRCMFGLPEGQEEMIDRLDSLCLVVDHQWSPITSLCRTREKTYQCIWSNLLGKQGMISCTWMKHGLTKITAQIICGFRMMGLMPQKYPRGKGKRLIVLHAGTRSEDWLIDLVFLTKAKDGDHHQEMNSVVVLEWFETQLIAALKNPSLVVLDNARDRKSVAFKLLLRNHWANLNQTLVEWSLDGPLPKLCPMIPTSNQDGHQAKNRKKGGWNLNCPLLL